MNIRIILIVSLLLFCIYANCSDLTIRKPAVSGTWYPSDPIQLNNVLDNFFKSAHKYKNIKPKAIIAPHAGYIYSGKMASNAYSSIINQEFDTIIILGSAHRLGFKGISIPPHNYYNTPLGNIPVARDLTKELLKSNNLFKELLKAHQKEHSIEAHLPFLQKTLKKEFAILPLLFGGINQKELELSFKLILKIYNKNPGKTLIIASTDMSHFHEYNKARKIDLNTIELIKNMDLHNFTDSISKGKAELCGSLPVYIVLKIAKHFDWQIDFSDYENSGDTAGDKKQVVGYCSFVFTDNNNIKGNENMTQEKPFLSNEQRIKLLTLARDSIKHYLTKNEYLKTNDYTDKIFQDNGAVFVTLHKNGNLRGCIGTMSPREPLYQAVIHLSVSSAVEDTRFSKVTLTELENIDIEISYLSPLKKINSIDEIEMGKHGVYLIKKGLLRNTGGVFLPQVAIETGWTKDRFLSELCSQKAGLRPDAYKTDTDLEWFIFTVEKFGEKDTLK